MSTLNEQLTALFKETNAAHHHAFAATDGADPEWATWYGHYLAAPMGRLLGRALDAARLTSELRSLDSDYQREKSDLTWQEYYARWFIARYAAGKS